MPCIFEEPRIDVSEVLSVASTDDVFGGGGGGKLEDDILLMLWERGVREVAFLGRCSVHVGYCVSLVVIDIASEDGILRAYRGANEDVAVEFGV